MSESSDKMARDFSFGSSLTLNPFPGENPRLHDSVQWWESSQTRFAASGLLTTAQGGAPTTAERIVDVPLDSLPDLPADHPHFEKRRETRIRTQAQNASNARQRFAIIMEGRTKVFAAIYQSAENSAPMFARELRERCDYARHGVDGGYFDGTLAYRIVYSKLFSTERTKADREFYKAAEQLQRSSRLSDGCKAEDFMRRAYAWIYKIRPHLPQAYSDSDAADFLIDMMPKRLASDARRIRGECQRDGTYLNLMHLARELEKVVFEDQTSPSPSPSLVVVPVDVSAKYDLVALSNMCGMALTANSSKLPKDSDLGMVAGDGTTKWCPRCPHGAGRSCFADPDFAGPFPPSVHLNPERKKAFLQAKALNAKKSGKTNARVSQEPSQQAIEEYKARVAARKDKKGRKPAGEQVGGGVALEAEAQPSSAQAFYDGLVDVTDGMCFVGTVGERPHDDASDELEHDDVDHELQWFVVEDGGERAVRGAVSLSYLDVVAGAACVCTRTT